MIDLTFINGKITFDDLSLLKNMDLLDQVESLKEDLLQVEYCESFLLDIGWYPSFEINGFFQIQVIKDYDWEIPLFISKAETIQALLIEIVAAQEFIGNEIKRN